MTNSYRTHLYAHYGSNFQDTPQEFDLGASRRWGKARRYQLRGWLPQDHSAKILDLACGRGWLLHFFKDQGYENVYGVDISPDQVAHAKQITPNVVQGSIFDYLSSHPQEFDLITGFDILEHLTKDEALQLFSLSYSSLKPGGAIILQTPNAAGPWGGYYFFSDLTHELGINTNSLRRLMRMFGYENFEVRECSPALWGYSVASTGRALLWQVIRLWFMVWNLIEIGTVGDRIYTRNLVVKGVRPHI